MHENVNSIFRVVMFGSFFKDRAANRNILIVLTENAVIDCITCITVPQ